MASLMLMFVMVLTRVHHFGDGFHLPDASWAVFFLLGWFGLRVRTLGIFLAMACLLDMWVISAGQVSGVCLTWGYGFLLPAYSVLWWAGLQLREQKLWQIISGLSLAVVVCFVLSNLGLWLFAPQANNLSLLQYSQRVIEYLPSYWQITLIYSFIGILLQRLSLSLMLIGLKQHLSK